MIRAHVPRALAGCAKAVMKMSAMAKLTMNAFPVWLRVSIMKTDPITYGKPEGRGKNVEKYNKWKGIDPNYIQ